ncbi:hypothetical protein [Vallitalea sp.]|jgi:hypothetical protein|uniref:hypothetical protein n=1 Tax=Vallitalea sp. TaxID=1882829 RepID=UPI0025E06477|nr:hypothetical protein [Vallitalea sp.]MCT4688117.1 hypothetical protein [Vallitalea sp.]
MLKKINNKIHSKVSKPNILEIEYNVESQIVFYFLMSLLSTVFAIVIIVGIKDNTLIDPIWEDISKYISTFIICNGVIMFLHLIPIVRYKTQPLVAIGSGIMSFVVANAPYLFVLLILDDRDCQQYTNFVMIPMGFSLFLILIHILRCIDGIQQLPFLQKLNEIYIRFIKLATYITGVAILIVLLGRYILLLIIQIHVLHGIYPILYGIYQGAKICIGIYLNIIFLEMSRIYLKLAYQVFLNPSYKNSYTKKQKEKIMNKRYEKKDKRYKKKQKLKPADTIIKMFFLKPFQYLLYMNSMLFLVMIGHFFDEGMPIAAIVSFVIFLGYSALILKWLLSYEIGNIGIWLIASFFALDVDYIAMVIILLIFGEEKVSDLMNGLPPNLVLVGMTIILVLPFVFFQRKNRMNKIIGYLRNFLNI